MSIRIARALVLLVLSVTASASGTEYDFEIQCRGLENYQITGRYRTDSGAGQILEKVRHVSFGISLGPMTERLVPAERPAGFRWFKVEQVSKATIRYGFKVKDKLLQATIMGATFNSCVNVIGRPETQEEFVALIRALAVAPCKVIRTVGVRRHDGG